MKESWPDNIRSRKYKFRATTLFATRKNINLAHVNHYSIIKSFGWKCKENNKSPLLWHDTIHIAFFSSFPSILSTFSFSLLSTLTLTLALSPPPRHTANVSPCILCELERVCSSTKNFSMSNSVFYSNGEAEEAAMWYAVFIINRHRGQKGNWSGNESSSNILVHIEWSDSDWM